MSYTIHVSLLKRLFPTPPSIALSAVGVDFSKTSIRFLKLEKKGRYLVPDKFIEKKFPEGSIVSGVIEDEKKLIPFLKNIKKEYGFSYARLTIPESKVFIFTVSFDKKKVKDIRKAISPLIEEYTLLKTKEANFDYSILKEFGNAVVVQVVVVPTKIIDSFVNVFEKAGIYILSIELDAQAIARAVVSEQEKGTQMIVDIGASHTGFSVVSNGVVVYTETLKFGGNKISENVSKKLGISIDEVEDIKIKSGMIKSLETDKVFKAFSSEVSVIAGEIARTFMMWQERKKLYGGFDEISKVYICGGNSNIFGIADYLSGELKIPVFLANPWTNCLDFNEIIPKLSLVEAISYTPAIGVALSNHIPSTNLLSQSLQNSIRQVRRLRLLSGTIWVAILMLIAFMVLLLPSYIPARQELKSLDVVLDRHIMNKEMVDIDDIFDLKNRVEFLKNDL